MFPAKSAILAMAQRGEQLECAMEAHMIEVEQADGSGGLAAESAHGNVPRTILSDVRIEPAAVDGSSSLAPTGTITLNDQAPRARADTRRDGVTVWADMPVLAEARSNNSFRLYLDAPAAGSDHRPDAKSADAG